MPTLRPHVLALTCLLAVFLVSAPARAQEKEADKSCDKPAVTLGPDGKTPSVDPLPEMPYFWGDHMDWPVLDRAAYQRLTVAAARLPALLIHARSFVLDTLSRAESPPPNADPMDRVPPPPEERAQWLEDYHELEEFQNAVDMAEENLFAVHEMLRVDHSWPCAANACARAARNARLAQKRLEESSRRMAALSRDTEESCLKARDAMMKLTPTLLRLMDEAIRPIEARACWKWADRSFPYSRFGKRTEEGIAELTALTDALEKLKAPKNAGKAWTQTWREAVTLARTARTSLERTGRFVQVGRASCTLFVNVVENRLNGMIWDRLRETMHELDDVAKRSGRIAPPTRNRLQELLLQLKRCCRKNSDMIKNISTSRHWIGNGPYGWMKTGWY